MYAYKKTTSNDFLTFITTAFRVRFEILVLKFKLLSNYFKYQFSYAKEIFKKHVRQNNVTILNLLNCLETIFITAFY